MDNNLIRFGGGGKSGKVRIDYKWVSSISEIKVIKKPTISFSSVLGNIVLIGDNIKNTFYIPNSWEKIYYFNNGYGYKHFYPQDIILYQDSINNKLTESTDYTYDRDTGLVTLLSTPIKNSLIAMTVTYDPERPKETTFYASFVFGELFKRIGFKYYKLGEPFLDTYPKVSSMSKSLLDTIWIPMMTGKIDLVYNPSVNIGQTIYVKDPKTGFSNVVFVKGFEKSLGKSPSLSIDILNYPNAMEIGNFGNNEVATHFKPELPTLGVSFIDETDDDNDYYGDGLWLRAEVLDLYNEKFNIFKNPVKVSLILGSKVREFPVSGSTYNQYYSKNKRGILSQYYTGSFRKSANGEWANDGELQADFPEFFDSEDPKLLVNKMVTLTMQDLKTNAKNTASVYVTFGHKRPFKGYYVPSYPYDPFVTFFENRASILMVDKDKKLWQIDTLMNSKYIDTLDFLTTDSFAIINSGNDLFIVDDSAHTVRRYNVNDKTYESYTVNDCLCGSNIFLNYKTITDDLGNQLFYFRGYSNITDSPYVSYVAFIKYKRVSNTMVKTKWRFDITGKAFAGIPFVYKNVVYFGKIGMNLNNASSYEGDQLWTSEASCPLIVDNSNLVFKNDFSLDKLKVVYMTDLLENNLWAVGSDCSLADDYTLTQPRVIGKEIIFGKRVDSNYDAGFDPSTDSTHWEKVAKFTSSSDDIESWDITPITVYGDKMLVLVKGSEPAKQIKDFNFGLAMFDPSDKKLHFKIIKYYGNNIKGSTLEQQLIHSIWFKDKVLYNWKDYSYLLSADDVITIAGE